MPVEEPLLLFLIGWPISLVAAIGTWTFIEKPALKHKDLPAHLAKSLLGENISKLLTRGAVPS
ncbi:MAG TPA: hypothetical protein PK823_02685 [Novosphingobium sp.]|nr:hypothetical protein [Novosphingobium sp.]